MPNLARAIEIAATAHKEQTRLDGSPYILHPLRLMFQLEGIASRFQLSGEWFWRISAEPLFCAHPLRMGELRNQE